MKKTAIITMSLLLSSITFAGNKVVSDQEAKQIITKFYNIYVLSINAKQLDNSTALNWGTPKFNNKLKKAYEAGYDCDNHDCYAAFALRTGAQDGPGKSGITNITPRSDGWYSVSYRDMGWKGVTDVKVVSINGVPKLDDYKLVYSNVK
jgi:hypothetical protein